MISVAQWVIFLGICILCTYGIEFEDSTHPEDYGSFATGNQLSPRALSSPRRVRTCSSDGACTKTCKRRGHDYGHCSGRRCICDDYPKSIKRMVKGSSSPRRGRLTFSRSKSYSRSKSPRRGSSPRRSPSRSPSRRLRSPIRKGRRGGYSSHRRNGYTSSRRRTSGTPSGRRKAYRTPPKKGKSPARRTGGSRSPRGSGDSRDDHRDSRNDISDSHDDRRDSRDYRTSSGSRPADVLSFDYSSDGRPPKVTYSQRPSSDGPPRGSLPSNSYQKGSRPALSEDFEEPVVGAGSGGMQGMGAAKPTDGGRAGGKNPVGDFNRIEEEEPDLQFAQKTPPPPVRGKGPKPQSASDQQIPLATELENETPKSGKQKPLPLEPVGREEKEGQQPEEEEEEEGVDGMVEEQLGGGSGGKPPAGKQSPADLGDEDDESDFMASGNSKLPEGGKGMGDIGDEEGLDDFGGLPSGKKGENQSLNDQQSMEDAYGKMPGKSPPFGSYDSKEDKFSGAPGSNGNDEMGGYNSGAKPSSAAKTGESAYDDMDDMEFNSMGDPSGQSSFGNGGLDEDDGMDFESKMGQKPSQEPAASSGKRMLPPVKNGKVDLDGSNSSEGTSKQPVPENQATTPTKKLNEESSSTTVAQKDDLALTGVASEKAAPQTEKKLSTMPPSIPDFDESHADIHGNDPKNVAPPGKASAVPHIDDDDDALEMPSTKLASTSLKKPSAKPSTIPDLDDEDEDFLRATAKQPVPLTGKNPEAKSSIDADFDDYDMEDLGTSLKKPPSASKKTESVTPGFGDEEDDDLLGANIKAAKTPENAAKLSKDHLDDVDTSLENSKEIENDGKGAKNQLNQVK